MEGRRGYAEFKHVLPEQVSVLAWACAVRTPDESHAEGRLPLRVKTSLCREAR